MLIALAAFVLIGIPNFKSALGQTLKGREDQIAKGENITQKNASEADKRWEFVTNWSMPPEDTLEFFNARVHGDTSCPFVLSINLANGIKPYEGALGRPLNAPRGNYRQHSLYVGWMTCLLALCGIVSIFFAPKGKRADRIFFVAAGVLFYLLSLGRYFEPTYRVIFSLPFGDLIRCPVKWHHLTEFCIAVTAAYGIEFLLQKLPRKLWYVPLALVLWGAVDLALEDKRYCAPVNVKQARLTNSSMQMTIMKRTDFQNPQVAAMVRAGKIVSVANYLGNPDYFVVGVLDKFGPAEKHPIPLFVMLFGTLSILTTLGIVGYGIYAVTRK